jgi:signal transduction histidine kinase
LLGKGADASSLVAVLPVVAFLNDLFGNRDRPKEDKPQKMSVSERENMLQRQLQQLRSLLSMTSSLSATLNYERVLEMTLDLTYGVLDEPSLPSSKIVGALLLFTDDSLYIAAARGLTHADMRVEFSGDQGVIEDALSSGAPRLVSNPSSDPELQRLVGVRACQVAVCMPLIVGIEVYGLLLFAHPNGDYFSPDRLEIIAAVANQAMVALQNAQLYRELEQEKERIMEIQEEAQKKLARDLHDGPTQSIGAIAMRVNFARRLLSRDPDSAAEELFKIEELARRTTKEIRQMLFTLRPLVLESEGLVPAIQQLAEKIQEAHNQKVIVEAAEGVAQDIEVGKQGVIFFIVDEAVNNARKHAQAEHIYVRLQRKGDMLFLDIEDDGVGFDVAAVEENYDQRGSLGMINLRERAELVNGLLRIESSKGKGTRVMVTVPITAAASEHLHRAGYSK